MGKNVLSPLAIGGNERGVFRASLNGTHFFILEDNMNESQTYEIVVKLLKKFPEMYKS